MTIKVLIVYERKNRELETAILLKYKLEKLGLDCDIAHFYQMSKFYIFSFKKYDVVIVPHLYNTEEVYRTIARYGNCDNIINLQYEQVLSEKWEKLGHHTPSGLAIKYKHICWGVKTQQRLISAGVPEDNVIVTGAIHCDLLGYLKSSSSDLKKWLGNKFSLSDSCNWKIFLSSFTYADISDEKLRQNENIANTNLEYFKYIHTQSRKELIEWFDKVLCDDEDSIFVYRPHPDEGDLSPLKYLENKYKNFNVIGSLSAKNWIQASDLIMSWYSTTVVESHFLDKSYAILRPVELSDDFDSVLLKKGVFIKTFEQFKNEVYFNTKFKQQALKDDDVGEYYGSKNSHASDELCALINSVGSNKNLEKVKVPLIAYIKIGALIVLKSIYHLSEKINLDLSFNKFSESLFFDFKNQIATPKEIADVMFQIKNVIENDEYV
ncbi:surface carbohydrate biosynthesis protein [Aeromonas simiae]|uniref:surface carbohydrate biosynthesis protein n=1 Tax=Aeromonas simiae TaxID=218936 RepID=UPI000A077B45|nr:surface carbohydrate biosynthesis protein [Aeromonas simiae]